MDAAAFLAEMRRFDAFGRPTATGTVDGLPYLTNEFWTAAQRRAHPIHEVSYRACFKPQLPEFFIARLTAPGEAVLDPFMGRGTTPVQAALMGRRPVGNDANPLSTLLTRPRLSPPDPSAVARRLADIPWGRPVAPRDDLLAFYHPATLRHICALRDWLAEVAPLDDPAPDPVADWIRMVALNRLTGHSPGFFSVYTLPPNQAASVANQRRINARRGQVPPERDVPALILKKTAQLLARGGPPPHPPALLTTGQAARMPALADASVALAVTSPPFLDIVHYAADNWLRCWFAGIGLDAVPIARHGSEAAWEAMVRATLAELARVLRPGGHLAFEVGEVRGGRVLLERAVWRAAEGLPLERLAVLVNRQDFTKTANCWGIANNRRGTNSNRIVLMRRA
ncbi:DNA methyltransferase [Falsiroseomonas sp. CW058]|uniref:DNA methyltransferase n=1 Tax=Falsiroseomonas sp. CW058 TaxID=3388664 RepID=UPI003D312E7B